MRFSRLTGHRHTGRLRPRRSLRPSLADQVLPHPVENEFNSSRRAFMPGDKADVVMFGPKPIIEDALTKAGLHLHKAWAAKDQEAFIAAIAPKVRAIAAVARRGPAGGAPMGGFPPPPNVSRLRVGHGHIDGHIGGPPRGILPHTPD